MTLREYCVGAGLTDHITDKQASESYYELGLAGEAGELLTANDDEKIYEAGDVMWYAVRLLFRLKGLGGVWDIDLNDFLGDCPEEKDDIEEIYKEDFWIMSILAFACEISDRRKKMIRDRAGRYNDDDVKVVKGRIYFLIVAVSFFAKFSGLTLQDICEKNLAKLASREARGVIGGSGDHR